MQTVADIYLGENHRLQIKGVVGFATVPYLRDVGNHLMKTHGIAQFDFKEVSRVDSAALALLTAWMRSSRQFGLKPSFIHLPTQLLDLVHLSNLDDILPIEVEKNNHTHILSPLPVGEGEGEGD